MTKRILLAAVLIVASIAVARSQGLLMGMFGTTSGGGIVATNFLLANTGSALLVNTGSKFLVQ
jgi:hypothetical protein